MGILKCLFYAYIFMKKKYEKESKKIKLKRYFFILKKYHLYQYS